MIDALIQFIIVDYSFNAVKTHISHTKIEVNRVYFLRFCTKFLT